MRRTGAMLLLTAMVSLIPLAPGAAAGRQDELAGVPRISQAEFKRLLDAGRVLVIDTRDTGSYERGHIPGAISVPLAELSKNVPRLKADKRPIVAYCA